MENKIIKFNERKTGNGSVSEIAGVFLFQFCGDNRTTKPCDSGNGEFMAFFQSAIDVMKTLVIALGAGLGVWGIVNLLESYGNDNPGANAHVW